MRFLRRLGDAIWVYLIPIAVVLNIVQPPLMYLVLGAVAALALTLLLALIFTVLISGRILLSLTQRRPATPDLRG